MSGPPRYTVRDKARNTFGYRLFRHFVPGWTQPGAPAPPPGGDCTWASHGTETWASSLTDTWATFC